MLMVGAGALAIGALGLYTYNMSQKEAEDEAEDVTNTTEANDSSRSEPRPAAQEAKEPEKSEEVKSAQ